MAKRHDSERTIAAVIMAGFAILGTICFVVAGFGTTFTCGRFALDRVDCEFESNFYWIGYKRFEIEDLRSVELQTIEMSMGGTGYRVVLETRDEKIPMTTAYESGGNGPAVADEISAFLANSGQESLEVSIGVAPFFGAFSLLFGVIGICGLYGVLTARADDVHRAQ